MSLVTWVWPAHVMLSSPSLGQKTLSSGEPQQLGQGTGREGSGSGGYLDKYLLASFLAHTCISQAASSLVFGMVQIHWFSFSFSIFQQQKWLTILYQISEFVQVYHPTISCLVFYSSRNKINYITYKSLQSQWRKLWLAYMILWP